MKNESGEEFLKVKSISNYFKKNYGKVHKFNIGDNIKFVDDICNNHNLEQIKMMDKRIIAEINVSRDTSYVNNHPISLLIALLTTIAALIVGMLTMGSQLINSYITHVVSINRKNITIENLNEMVNSLDYSTLMNIIVIYICIIFFIIFSAIMIISSLAKKSTKELYNCSVLIKEAIEKKLDEIEKNNFIYDSQFKNESKDVYDLIKYSLLLDEGILTSEEFVALKKKTLEL